MGFPAVLSQEDCDAHLPSGNMLIPQFARPVNLAHLMRGWERLFKKVDSLLAKASLLSSVIEIVIELQWFQ